jgi:uncharacterized protein involved in response to NO
LTQQPVPPAAATGFALWNLGFRPFYLLASIFSAISVLLWAAQFSGYFSSAYLRGPVWHGHEMLFGYTMAVIAGFLLTAVRAWTDQPTPTGVPLMALAALWVLGRALVLTPLATAAAVVNAAFPLALAVAIGIPLVRSRNVRNYFFVGLLVLMGGLTAAPGVAGRVQLPPRLGLLLGLDVVLFIMTVMGGASFRCSPTAGGGRGRNALPAGGKAGAGIRAAAVRRRPSPVATCGRRRDCAVRRDRARHAPYLWRSWRTAAPLVWILHAARLDRRASGAARAGGAGWIADRAPSALTVGAMAD